MQTCRPGLSGLSTVLPWSRVEFRLESSTFWFVRLLLDEDVFCMVLLPWQVNHHEWKTAGNAEVSCSLCVCGGVGALQRGVGTGQHTGVDMPSSWQEIPRTERWHKNFWGPEELAIPIFLGCNEIGRQRSAHQRERERDRYYIYIYIVINIYIYIYYICTPGSSKWHAQPPIWSHFTPKNGDLTTSKVSRWRSWCMEIHRCIHTYVCTYIRT